MTGEPHTVAPNTFQAILRSSSPKTVSISQEEYGIIQELRRLLNMGRQHQMMIGFRDGKFFIYHVSLATTLAPVAKDG